MVPPPKDGRRPGLAPEALAGVHAHALGQHPCPPPPGGPPCPSTTLSTDKGRRDRAHPAPHCGSHHRTTQPARSTSPGLRPWVLCRWGVLQPPRLPEPPAESCCHLPSSLSGPRELGDFSSLGFL